MSALSCLALIIAMEAGNQSIQTQDLVAEFAMNRAEELGKPICETLKIKGLYSWVGGKRKPSKLEKDQAEVVADHVLRRRSLKQYKFFNVCSGKKFKTGQRLKSGDVCFY